MIKKQLNNQAFTLLEILIALAVLSIIMIVSVRNIGSLSDNSSYIREKTIAHWVAMNKVSELKLSRKLLQVSTTKGTVSMAETKWQWNLKVKATSDLDIRKAEVSVNKAGDSGKNPAAVITAYIGRRPS